MHGCGGSGDFKLSLNRLLYPLLLCPPLFYPLSESLFRHLYAGTHEFHTQKESNLSITENTQRLSVEYFAYK